MDELARDPIWQFDLFELDAASGCLFRLNGVAGREEVTLGSRALAVLAALVTRAGQLVSKQELLDEVWPNTAVEEKNLAVQISTLRRKLDQGRTGRSCIQTVPGRGYRLAVASSRRLLAEEASVPSPRLSIVVLPFTTPSEDHAQQYFADALVEELTMDLSRLEGSFVISRETAFTYRDKPVDAKQIGRELNVRYVLGGSVRRSGGRLRVNAHLIETATDRHLWVGRFEGDTFDLFVLQDDITSQLANALSVELVATEATRSSEYPDALDLVFRGRALQFQHRTGELYLEAIAFFEQALALRPGSVEATIYLARALVTRVLNGLSDTATEDLSRAEALVDQALAWSNRSAHALLVKAYICQAQGRYSEAAVEFQAALELDRNLASAVGGLAWCKLHAGLIEDVIPLVERAILLSPREPGICGRYYLAGTIHLLSSNVDAAIVWLEKARHVSPTMPFYRARLAAAYALSGEVERASVELLHAQRLDGSGLFSSITNLKTFPGAWSGSPQIREFVRGHILCWIAKGWDVGALIPA